MRKIVSVTKRILNSAQEATGSFIFPIQTPFRRIFLRAESEEGCYLRPVLPLGLVDSTFPIGERGFVHAKDFLAILGFHSECEPAPLNMVTNVNHFARLPATSV